MHTCVNQMFNIQSSLS